MIPWRPLSFGLNGSALYFARYMFLRLLPMPLVRHGVGRCIAFFATLTGGKREAPLASPAVNEVVNRIKSSGFSALPPVLTASQAAEVRAFLAEQPAYDGKREFFVTSGPCDALRASYPVATILKCPHLLRAINSPEALSIAEAYLGCKPTIAALGLNWSFPQPGREADVQQFHRDSEAWRLLNMFIYLTDVDDEAGPHRYVLGSHRTMGRVRLTPYSESQVNDRFGKSSTHNILGPEGTTFIEDGWGIHEANPPISKRRLILAVMYSLGPIPIYDYERVKVAETHDYDKYVNRLLFA